MAAKPVNRYNGLENVKARSRNNVVQTVLNIDTNAVRNSNLTFSDIPLDKIIERSINQYSQTRIEVLAKSIRNTNNRLINPISVCRVEHLPKDGEVLKRFTQNKIAFSKVLEGMFSDPAELEKEIQKLKTAGFEISDKEYVIISGHRRFRAFKILQQEENEKEHGYSFVNPFDLITANILSKEEAQNETVFYEDSNTMSRQLSGSERLRLFELALSQVVTSEAKRQALIEMEAAGYKFDKPIPADVNAAARMFRKDKYCAYFLSCELGVDDYNESTARNYVWVLNNVSEELKLVMYDGDISFTEGQKLCKFDFNVQHKLVDLFKAGKVEEYNRLIQKMQEKSGGNKVKTHFTYKTASRTLKSTISDLEKSIEKIREQESNLGGKDKEIMAQAIKKCEALIGEIKRLDESFAE